MRFRLYLVLPSLLVLLVHSASGNFGEFIYNFPLKLTDSVASLFRLFEENFRYHTPAERVNFKRSELMSKIQNSFDDYQTTPKNDRVATKYPNSYRKSNLNVYDSDKRDHDEGIKGGIKGNKSKYISDSQDVVLAPVVPLKIPYIPQPKSGIQDFFISTRKLGGALNKSEPRALTIADIITTTKPEIISTTDMGFVIEIKKLRFKVSSNLLFYW